MHPLIISKKILLPLIIVGLLMTLIGSYMKLSHYRSGFLPNNVLIGIGLALCLFVWVFAVSDAVRNKIKNPWMWFVAFLFFGSIASLIYLLNRDSIIINREVKRAPFE